MKNMMERDRPRWFTSSAVAAIGEVLLIVAIVAALLLPALVVSSRG